MFTGIFGSLAVRLMLAVLTSFFIAVFIGPRVIENLKQRQIGQMIREEGVQAHKKKAGTPTMGGIIILIPLVITVIFWAQWNFFVGLVLFAGLAMGFIGLLDDLTKVIKVRSLGLTPRQKLAGQIAVGLVVGLAILSWSGARFELLSLPGGGQGLASSVEQSRSVTYIPFLGLRDIGWWFLPLAVFIMVGAANAVNLTDGLDGLAGGTFSAAILPFTFFAILFANDGLSGSLQMLHIPGIEELAIVGSALLGGCLGFLWFNSHPAEVFMGDTGSLALGGFIGAISISTKTELFLGIIGGVFVLEALSVIIQVSYFKWSGGKRVFRMSPIHHHFELCGWPEEKVVMRFWIAGLFLALGGLAILFRTLG